MLFLTRRLVNARRLVRDTAVVNLPDGVGKCSVFRNVVTMEEEQRIYEELGQVLVRDGYPIILEGSSSDNKIVKQTYLEMYGIRQEYTEVKNWTRKEVRRLPGFVWSPTFLKILEQVCQALGRGMPDSGRVVEHNLPGYEQHVEHPTVGNEFFYFNFLSDTVLEFDDEATSRTGQVYLPSRSLMVLSDEARWGFRFGELPEDPHTFVNQQGREKSVECDLRLSVQTWTLCHKLIDNQMLQERLGESVALLEKRIASDAAKSVAHEEEELGRAVVPGETESPPGTGAAGGAGGLNAFISSAIERSNVKGKLGGEYAEATEKKQSMSEVKQDYDRYKEQFSNIHGILQDMKSMQDAGQPVNDLWLSKKMKTNVSSDEERDRAEGFDASNIEGTWDNVDAKARFYKEKLKKMDYDGTAFSNSRLPDMSGETPLDMKGTIRKIAPFVKDGEKILSQLPQS